MSIAKHMESIFLAAVAACALAGAAQARAPQAQALSAPLAASQPRGSASAPVGPLQVVVVKGKRLSAAQKAQRSRP